MSCRVVGRRIVVDALMNIEKKSVSFIVEMMSHVIYTILSFPIALLRVTEQLTVRFQLIW